MKVFFDTEIIGSKFLICVLGPRLKKAFWLHRKGDMEAFYKLLPKHTFIGFNSENFDRPLIAAALQGADGEYLQALAQRIIEDNMRSWETYKRHDIDFVEYDHIDIMEPAPGVMVSLKTYAGRLSYPNMIDMPVHHTHDLKPSELTMVEEYCFNDCGVTKALYESIEDSIKLREQLGVEYDLDLRSKSDAQAAEAILKKAIGINGKLDKATPSYVTYTTPSFIRTKSPEILTLIDLLENESFKINFANGSPEMPEWMKDEFKLRHGTYQVGLGGLHSTHDVNFHIQASDLLSISDFDVASYYPNIIMKAGLIPRFGGNKGQRFLEEYKNIYNRRIEAKHSGDKTVANTLKIVLNGTYGKLGSIYSAFYSPDLMLAVTFTGQLNLLCLIDELEKIKGVRVFSANTDGITVGYFPNLRDKVLAVFEKNAKRTGFEYEETPYKSISMKDVNNYIAITTDGKIKSKGLYAETSLQKNPTMEVCSKMARDYLQEGIRPEENLARYTDIKDFVAIRNVKGGGVQHTRLELRDDWEEVEERLWVSASTGKKEKRKSRPKPFEIGVGGKPFGRVARWYMTTEQLPSITYVGSGNQVPKTEGAKLCMHLPKKLPKDLDRKWYIKETYNILKDLGVDVC